VSGPLEFAVDAVRTRAEMRRAGISGQGPGPLITRRGGCGTLVVRSPRPPAAAVPSGTRSSPVRPPIDERVNLIDSRK
jgi:hypothetical protein